MHWNGWANLHAWRVCVCVWVVPCLRGREKGVEIHARTHQTSIQWKIVNFTFFPPHIFRQDIYVRRRSVGPGPLSPIHTHSHIRLQAAGWMAGYAISGYIGENCLDVARIQWNRDGNHWFELLALLCSALLGRNRALQRATLIIIYKRLFFSLPHRKSQRSQKRKII